MKKALLAVLLLSVFSSLCLAQEDSTQILPDVKTEETKQIPVKRHKWEIGAKTYNLSDLPGCLNIGYRISEKIAVDLDIDVSISEDPYGDHRTKYYDLSNYLDIKLYLHKKEALLKYYIGVKPGWKFMESVRHDETDTLGSYYEYSGISRHYYLYAILGIEKEFTLFNNSFALELSCSPIGAAYHSYSSSEKLYNARIDALTERESWNYVYDTGMYRTIFVTFKYLP